MCSWKLLKQDSGVSSGGQQGLLPAALGTAQAEVGTAEALVCARAVTPFVAALRVARTFKIRYRGHRETLMPVSGEGQGLNQVPISLPGPASEAPPSTQGPQHTDWPEASQKGFLCDQGGEP